MATFVVCEGLLSLDKEQLAQLQAAGEAQALTGPIVHTLHELAQYLSHGQPVYVYPDDAALTMHAPAFSATLRELDAAAQQSSDRTEVPADD